MADSHWKSYEEVAQHLLDQFAEHLSIKRMEGKQEIVGQISGRVIEIDGKGVKEGEAGFVILECKDHSRRVNAGHLEALAFRILDAGADGGIIVSPLELQAGATKIAASQKIVTAQLSHNATPAEYVLRLLNRIMIGVQETLNLKQKACFDVLRKESPKRIILEIEEHLELQSDDDKNAEGMGA